MSSTPVTPAQPAGLQTPAFIQHWITFVKAHEKLLIAGLAAFLIFHFYSKAIDAWVQNKKTDAQIALAQAKGTDAQTAALQVQVQQLQAQLVAQNKQQIAQIAAQKIVTQKQQQIDATLSPTDLTARLAKLVNVPPAEITPAAVPNQVVFSEDAAVATAQQLETIPELQAEVTSLNTIVTNDNTIISKQTDLITQLNTDIKTEKASHADDVKQLKAQNHKSWLNGFKWGIISGFTLGLVAHAEGA